MLEFISHFINVDMKSLFLENWFVIIAALFWLAVASIQDLKRREVENWWSFSLIAFVLAYRAFFSIEKGEIMYFFWSLIGLSIGFILMNLFYYARMFAGGDAKLLMAICCVLPLSLDWRINLLLLLGFVLAFMIAGAIYGLIYSLVLMIFNFRDFWKSFIKIFKKSKKIFWGFELIIILILLGLFFIHLELIAFLFVILLFYPILFMFAKSIEESCMNKLVEVKYLTIGDWLSKPLKIRNRIIKPNWEGLNENQLKFIQKNYRRKILVKYGIPFVPAFLLGFLALIILLSLI